MVEGLSISQIAAETFSSKKTVKKYLVRVGVPLRARDQDGNYRIKYGQKNINGHIVDDKVEQETLRIITSLRDHGHSVREIVAIAQSLNLPTKKIGSRWHIKTIFSLLKRQDKPQR